MIKDIITSYASIGISVLALIVSLGTFILNYVQQQKIDTLNAINILQGEVLDVLNEISDSDIQKLVQESNHQSRDYLEIVVLLARLEHFSAGIEEKVYNKDLVFRIAGGYLLRLYEKYKPFIENKRKEAGCEKYYTYYQQMAESIDKTSGRTS